MSTTVNFLTGSAITDLNNGTPANRKLAMVWTGGRCAFVTISNRSDEVVSLRSDTTTAEGGIVIPAGGLWREGPFLPTQNLYLYETGTGSAHYAFTPVFSEVP